MPTIPFLIRHDVIDLLKFIELEISDDPNHPVRQEWQYFIEEKRNDTGYMYDIADENMPIINQFLIEFWAYEPGQKIIFWVSW